MKYKVITNSCVPGIRLALSTGQILDDEVDKRLTPEIIKQMKRDKQIEGDKPEAKTKKKDDE